MCSKLKYIVLALCLDAIASTPYNIPRYNGNYNLEEAYLPRNIPSYMSPVPTAVDSDQEILRESNNLRDPRSLHDANEYSRTDEHLPSIAQSARSYTNPSSTLNGNEVLSHLLLQNRPVVETSVPVDGKENLNEINGERFNNIPLNGNIRSEVSSHVGYTNYVPLKIQSVPEQRIAFQPPVLPNVANLDSYRPAIPVRSFNMDREWANIAKEPPKLPDFISERLSHPVESQQVHKPLNAEMSGTRHQYNIQQIISDQRIQKVLASTKQTKRYLVIHPNGTVEHVDNLAPIASQNPNYVLVNAGHVVAANNLKTDVNTEKHNVQLPVPTLEPISSKLPVVSGTQLPEPVFKNEEAFVQTSLPEAAPASSSVAPIAPESVIVSSSTAATNISSATAPSLDNTENQESEARSEETDGTANVVDTSSVTPEIIPTEPVTENDTTPAVANTAENITEDSSPAVPEQTSKNGSNSTKQSTQIIENVTNSEKNEVNNLGSVRPRRAGKPMVYYTSDPDFWRKVTDGKDSNFIYFFQVKSSPRVETDRQRTVYPDGTILEELTETVWDGEGGAPKVTKSSKIIRPDEL